MGARRGAARGCAPAEIAASVGASRRLLPHLRELMADLGALGSSPRLVAAMLGRAGVGPGPRVLDLACGKGVVGIALARTLGAEVVGVDGFGAFVDEARARAARAGVGGQCAWHVGDVRGFRVRERFDVSMMLGLFGVEGALAILRRGTRPGGVYLLDDATCEAGEDGADEDGPGAGLTCARARRLIEREGDRVLEVRRRTPGAARRQHAVIYGRLRARARAMARERPALAGELARFMEQQRAANRMLEGPLRATIWLVRRG